jgi:hypothetical protein
MPLGEIVKLADNLEATVGDPDNLGGDPSVDTRFA